MAPKSFQNYDSLSRLTAKTSARRKPAAQKASGPAPGHGIPLAVVILFLSTVQIGCGGGNQSSYPSGSTNRAGAPPANISISPGSALVGSPALTLTITGSGFTFVVGAVHYSIAVWSQGGVDTPLLTTFVSNSQLTAIVPAELLTSVVTAKVRVEIWDHIENTLVAASSSIPFQVSTTLPIPTPSISSLSTAQVTAGSPDLTITIDGSNFGRFGHFVSSTAFWTTSASLHDTGKWLQTTIGSDTQLTVVIPAALLQKPTSVQIVVMNGDVMGMSDGYFGYPRSNAVSFQVTP
jgi:hypothetical protein